MGQLSPSRRAANYCGPAAVASALGITREEAARRLLEVQPRSRGWFHWRTLAAVLRLGWGRIVRYPDDDRPTLAAWLETDGRDAILFVSRHFVHVAGGRVVEANGREPRRGRVRVALLLRRR